MSRKVAQFLVRFDPDLFVRFRREAKARRMSMNQAVQQAVERWVDQ